MSIFSNNCDHKEIDSRNFILFSDFRQAIKSLENFFNFLIESEQFSTRGAIIDNASLFQDSSFDRISDQVKLFPNVKKYSNNKLQNLLGATNDFILIDQKRRFDPNKLILATETVVGGGLIILLGEKHELWIQNVNKDRFEYSEESSLLKFFLENFKDNPNCISLSNEELDLIPYYNPISMREILSEEFLKIPVSTDQKKLIKTLSKDLGGDTKKNKVSIIIADRGRGKSAAVGLIIADAIIKSGSDKTRIVITALTVTQTQTIFGFIALGLEKSGVIYHYQRKNEQVVGISITRRKKIEYCKPEQVSKDIHADIIVVDEAAAFPPEKMTEVLYSKSRKVLISTIHGYEGTGRSFQHKIVDSLKRRPNFSYHQYDLEEPIRYAKNDLIEQLLNDTFLLQVEPPLIESNTFKASEKDIEFVQLKSPPELFRGRNFELLKNIMGLLIFSHYRNQPNDLLLIADSNRHFLAYLNYSNQNNKSGILLACQLAEEGGLTDNLIEKGSQGEFIEGNLIPGIAIRQFSRKFAKLKGMRIVRIASHPDFRNKGLGRMAVERIIKNYHSLDWIGVSFGATEKLVKFWKKFGFKVVQIRPIKTPETSEWNVVLIKPLSDQAKVVVEQASSDFFFQFVHLLKQSLFDLKPELALLIIQSCISTSDYTTRISKSGYYRLRKYIEGNINFLLVVDVLYELTITYFAKPLDIKLSTSQKLLLISRILQGRTWGQTLGKTGLHWKEANGLLVKAIRKIAGTIETQ